VNIRAPTPDAQSADGMNTRVLPHDTRIAGFLENLAGNPRHGNPVGMECGGKRSATPLWLGTTRSNAAFPAAVPSGSSRSSRGSTSNPGTRTHSTHSFSSSARHETPSAMRGGSFPMNWPHPRHRGPSHLSHYSLWRRRMTDRAGIPESQWPRHARPSILHQEMPTQ